jgi:hypothetical protein
MTDFQRLTALLGVVVLLTGLATYQFIMSLEMKHKKIVKDPRGIEIVLVREPGDTTRFFVPPEAQRKVVGPIVSF